MLEGALGSVFALSETLTRAAPLILTGLAAAVAFPRPALEHRGRGPALRRRPRRRVARHRGAIEAGPLTLPLVMGAAALAGAALMLGPAWLKVRLGADEVVTTLLLNFVALLFVQMMLEGPLQDPLGMGWPQSPPGGGGGRAAGAPAPHAAPRGAPDWARASRR